MTTDYGEVGGADKTLDTPDESTTECPVCGVAVVGITARAPTGRGLEHWPEQ